MKSYYIILILHLEHSVSGSFFKLHRPVSDHLYGQEQMNTDVENATRDR